MGGCSFGICSGVDRSFDWISGNAVSLLVGHSARVRPPESARLQTQVVTSEMSDGVVANRGTDVVDRVHHNAVA
jgi:hypothetical protein